MKAKLTSLDDKATGDISLNPSVFSIEPRQDILARVVEWQRAKARAGTHKVKERNEVKATTKKPFKQKGTGNARQGTRVAPHHRGGGVAHGPKVRSHAHSLPKKVRVLGLKMALSAKAADKKLAVIDSLKIKNGKTSELKKLLAKHDYANALFIDGAAVEKTFALASRNIMHVDVLPQIGANVYDILRHDQLILTKEAVTLLEERLA